MDLVWLYLSTQRNFILIYIPFSEYTFFYSGLLRPWIHTLSWTISSYPPMIQCLLDDRRRHGTFVLKMASARDATLMDWLEQCSHNQPWRPAILKFFLSFFGYKVVPFPFLSGLIKRVSSLEKDYLVVFYYLSLKSCLIREGTTVYIK